jgi:uncharacterized membrane protein YccF (DUF307 family)
MIYTLFIGIPLCVLFNIMGVMLCLTIIGFPFGISCFQMANKVLTLQG